MSLKQFITIGIVIGSTIGAYMPVLWGSSGFDIISISGAFIGGMVGIWAGYRIWKNFS